MHARRSSLPRRWLRPVVLVLFLAGAAAGCLAAADPTVPALPEQLARAQAQKDPGAVVEIGRRALEKPGADALPLLRAIFQAQVDLKDLPRAAETLERLQKTTPPPPRAALTEMRGDLLRAQDKPLDEALAAWREAITQDPADLPGLEGKIADALDTAGRWEEAAAAFRAVLHHVPGHAARQARLAVCLLNAGHSAEADQVIVAAGVADADDETVKAVAPLFDRLRPSLPALKKLESRLATANPPDANAPAAATADVAAGANTLAATCLDRAVILSRAGAWAGALVDAERAARVGGGQSQAARLLRGQCLWQLERPKEAVALSVARIADKKWFDDLDAFNRLRAADNAPALSGAAAVRAHTVRATILLGAEELPLALEETVRAHELNEAGRLRLDDPEVVYAVVLLRNDRPAEALLAARRATEYAPNNPDGWAILGRLEQETRADFAAATEHLSRALSLREEPRWLRRRETCLRSLGRTAEADRDAQRLAKLPPAS